MDKLDYQILAELKKNARQTASEISKTIHLSVSTVIERIKKMEKSGLIRTYTVITDDHKFGNDITVLMEVGMEHPRYNDDFIRYINNAPNIVACYYLTGEFDFLLKICCRSSEHLEQIHNQIKDCAGVRLTKTHYVLRTVKNIYTADQLYDDEEE
jgi:Lrp/AsnC family leucine-responsive transcriptional regulator